MDRQIEQWRPGNVVIGALASIPNDLECSLEKGISYNVQILQKSVLLGTTNIIRKVLFIKQ